MTEVTGMELVLPHSGEIIDPADTARVAEAYHEVERLEAAARRAKAALGDVLRDHASVVGAKTFRVGGHKVEISGGERTTYDGDALAEDLRVAGMPESAVDEIVTQEVTTKVDARRLKQAARANEKYAEAMDRHATVVVTTPRVVVS